jgi:hypothetical protein
VRRLDLPDCCYLLLPAAAAAAACCCCCCLLLLLLPAAAAARWNMLNSLPLLRQVGPAAVWKAAI